MIDMNRPGDVEDGHATKCIYSTYCSDNDYRTSPNVAHAFGTEGNCDPREINDLKGV